MILFTNGCSWTYGGSLNLDGEEHDIVRLKSVWPKYLGEMLGAKKVINLARGCGSNQYIARTTYEWFLQEYCGEEIVVVIQWAEPSRYEYYVTNKPFDDFSNIPNNWAAAKFQSAITVETDFKSVMEQINERLSTYTEIEGMFKQILYYSSLAFLFNALNVKYYFWSQLPMLPINSPELYTKYVKKNFNFIGDFNSNWQYERVSPCDAHPSLLGHKQLAGIIHELIRTQPLAIPQ